MVGSLSGTMEEVYLAKEAIHKWNQQHAERMGKLFMPVEWTIKKEDIQHADLMIGIVGNWIDNTIFIEDIIKLGKHVSLFISAKQDPLNTIPSELKIVQSFIKKVCAQCYCNYYGGTSQLIDCLNEQLVVF